jgi:hypothetical protein
MNITTKFNPKDTVFFLHKDVIKPAVVISIKIKVQQLNEDETVEAHKYLIERRTRRGDNGYKWITPDKLHASPDILTASLIAHADTTPVHE